MTRTDKRIPGRLLIVAAAVLLFTGCADKEKEKQKALSVKEFCSELFLKGEFPSALTRCLEAERLAPEDADVQLLLGLIYRGMRNFPEAINRMNKAVELKADLPEAYTNLGIMYSETGRAQEAIEAFDKALSFPFYTKPDLVHINKCEVFLRVKDYKHALDSCRAATLSNRASWEGHMKTGDVLFAMDRVPEAIDEYETAIRHGPKFPQPYYQLGLLYMNRKDYPKACENYFRVREISGDSEIGDKAIRYIKQLACKEPSKEDAKLPPKLNLDHLEKDRKNSAKGAR